MDDLLLNRLHEKVRWLDAQFVKKIPLAMIIGQQMKVEGLE